MPRVLVLVLFVAACGSDGGLSEVGECAPPDDGVDLPIAAIDLSVDHCLVQGGSNINVVDSVAQWDALFDCPTQVPAGLDLTTQRAAVVHLQCSPIDYRFTAERTDEIVVGVLSRVSGACLGNVVVVPLPRSTKPVRVAQCSEQCEQCPPAARVGD